MCFSGYDYFDGFSGRRMFVPDVFLDDKHNYSLMVFGSGALETPRFSHILSINDENGGAPQVH